MALSRGVILERIRKGDLVFNPEIDQFQLQMHSVDLRLGFLFLIPKSWEITEEGRVAIITDHLDMNNGKEKFTSIELNEGQYFDVLPGEYIAVSTLETVTLSSDLMAILFPRSSINRRGLSIDLTGIVDAGYEGKLLIPVRNNTSDQIIRLYPGERFCQLLFEEVNGFIDVQKSRWHNQDLTKTIKAEKSELEMSYLKSGKISELKRKFHLNYS